MIYYIDTKERQQTRKAIMILMSLGFGYFGFTIQGGARQV
jgi:hypothetical protein